MSTCTIVLLREKNLTAQFSQDPKDEERFSSVSFGTPRTGQIFQENPEWETLIIPFSKRFLKKSLSSQEILEEKENMSRYLEKKLP